MSCPTCGERTPGRERTRKASARRDRGEWAPAFLEALRNSGNVRASCRAAGISRQSAYDFRGNDAPFATAWQEALDEAIDVLEAAARQRALHSSDTLLIFLLKAHRPEVYRERVDMRVDVRLAAERLAKTTGLDADELLAEADRIFRDSARGAAARMEWAGAEDAE